MDAHVKGPQNGGGAAESRDPAASQSWRFALERRLPPRDVTGAIVEGPLSIGWVSTTQAVRRCSLADSYVGGRDAFSCEILSITYERLKGASSSFYSDV